MNYFTANINYVEQTELLTFDSDKTDITVNVSIIVTNETMLAEDEEFLVHLSFPGGPIPRVTLAPDNATIAIFEINGEGKSYQPFSIL